MTEEKNEKEKSPTNEYILEHQYNSKFELLTPEEVKEILSKFNVSLIKLPKILVNDPVCKLYKAKINDVFRIVRRSYTSGTSVYYRVVVDG